jgi:two-component system sensor histidine kinase ChvG
MLANPVDNAVSFSPPGSIVELRLSEGSVGGVSGYALTVDDDGPGVRLSSMPRVFDRFYSDRPEGSGDDHAGLGLSIVQAIVSSYGGACALENRTTGGCRFSLALPKAR